MATERTHRVIAVGDAIAKVNTAIIERNRLREEAIKLTRKRRAIDQMLADIDKKEDELTVIIDDYSGVIADAITGGQNSGAEAIEEIIEEGPGATGDGGAAEGGAARGGGG